MSLGTSSSKCYRSLTKTRPGYLRYDYYTLEYWTGLLNTFLDGGDVSVLSPPPASSAYKPKL